ncbi:MAG: ABC transporter substrate-binding protein [Chloroflexi bacterium]|nr:ABC transporter substrate-binding protein [Chloroflexota bacterium]
MGTRSYPGELALVGACLVAVWLLACGPGPAARGPGPSPEAVRPAAAPAAAAAQAPAPPTPVKIRAAYTTFSGSVAPWWAAAEGGYFREQGLDVELVLVEPGASLLAALRNGELDVTYSGAPSIVLGYAQGLETIIVGATTNLLDNSLYVRPEAVPSVADLRGKTIGVTRLKAITDVTVRLIAQRLGLDPDTDLVIRGTGGYPQTLAGLEAGVLDGAALSPEAAFEAQRRGYRELANAQQLGLVFMNGTVATVRRTAAERPEVIDRTLRALAQGIARMRTDREFGVRTWAAYSRNDNTELLGQLIDFYREVWVPDLYPDPAALQTAIDVEENPPARTIRPEDVIDFQFADRLRQSGFLATLPQ